MTTLHTLWLREAAGEDKQVERAVNTFIAEYDGAGREFAKRGAEIAARCAECRVADLNVKQIADAMMTLIDVKD